MEKKASKKTAVNAAVERLQDEDDSDSGSEYEETSAWSRVPGSAAHKVCMTAPVTHQQNSFSAFLETGEDHDDEDHLIEALSSFANKVTVGKPTQSQRQKEKMQPLTRQQVKNIAAAVRSGKIQWPDVSELVTNDRELKAVWALVDSGAGAHCANGPIHFPGSTTSPLQEDQVSTLVNASGGEMKVRGCVTIAARTNEGETLSLPFLDADVSMPIVSAAQLTESGQYNL